MSKPQMTLGELIRALERQDQDEPVKFDFVHFGPTTLASYRGYYDHLALGYEECGRTHHAEQYEYPKVKELLAHCREALGKKFTGWKGGDFVMAADTPVWVANPGETGSTAIVNVEAHTYVTLITELCE